MYGVNNNEIGEQFVNKYVTLNNSLFFSNLQNSQMHKHTWTYRKKNYGLHYILPHMPYTKIQESLNEAIPSSKTKKLIWCYK